MSSARRKTAMACTSGPRVDGALDAPVPVAAGGGNTEGPFTIGALADEFGITTRAIRFYEAKGLLRPARSGQNRSYSRRDRARVALILRGKNLGFTLEDIAEYLSLYDGDPSQQAQTRLLLAKVDAHIEALETKLADIERTLRELKDIRAQCTGHLERG